MRIGLVGYGFVGRAISRFFSQSHSISVYDKFIPEHASSDAQDQINTCDLAFVAVPTPTGEDGLSCNLSAVYEVFSWLRVPACIKSTIPPGTTDRIRDNAKLPIAFSPEYIGERVGHEWNALDSCGFVIVGGDETTCDLVISAYQHATSKKLEYCKTDTNTAELCKYMENCFLATKVAFSNQFYDIANYFGVDFEKLKALWLLDPRVAASHTSVSPERGFGGRCLPKDLRAIIAATKPLGGSPFLESLLAYNEDLSRRSRATKESLPEKNLQLA
jgi:UDPglucose 6-dehydrogenase